MINDVRIIRVYEHIPYFIRINEYFELAKFELSRFIESLKRNDMFEQVFRLHISGSI